MRNKTVPLLLPLLPAALLLLFFVRTALGDLSGDSARYLLLGRSLAEGRGYVELEKPDAPPHTEYGPGLPALIAPGLALTDSILPAKLVVAAGWLAAVALIAFIARDRLALSPGKLYLIVPLICALLPAPARFANQVLSDLPYGAASLLASGGRWHTICAVAGPARRWPPASRMSGSTSSTPRCLTRSPDRTCVPPRSRR